MQDLSGDTSFVFIIGSPRSGTTVLGEILNKHCDISQWYEPYFVWDRYLRAHPHDERTAEDATPKIRKQIYSEFQGYKKRTRSRIVVDKSPRNSLKLPFIRTIFPQARFIHILRDGRDVTLSIHREWIRRRDIVRSGDENVGFDYGQAFRVIFQWLKRQRFLDHKMRAFWFETHGHLFNRSRHLNRLRWNGEVGWGPRFKDWESVFSRHSILQFNALQWLNSVESIRKYWPEIPNDKKLEIRYEQLTNEGMKTLTEVLTFMKCNAYDQFFTSIPKLKKNNFNKWKTEFSRHQLQEIHPILTPMLIELGYESTHNWLTEMA